MIIKETESMWLQKLKYNKRKKEELRVGGRKREGRIRYHYALRAIHEIHEMCSLYAHFEEKKKCRI